MENILKVVVAGEIDSGKSTLIGRLLYDTGSLHQDQMLEISSLGEINGNPLEFAYLLDSLQEERQGRLTIDTTQILCRHGKSGFLFIDVPGHVELLKNMLSGSSYSQAAVLVTDVTKPLEDGTVRHINVLKFLGIRQMAVVLNKMDLLGFDKDAFARAKEEISAFIASIGMKAEYFIPLSARQGDNLVKESVNLAWYKGPCLIAALDSLGRVNRKGKKRGFYFPIQDVYLRQGRPVYVGTILSGRIHKNDAVYVSGDSKAGKIKTIKVFGKNKLSAQSPESIGIELAGADGLNRGQIIYKDDQLSLSAEITAKILCVQPISREDKLFFSCATQQTPCSIKQINKFSSISPGVTSGSKTGLNKADVAQVVIAMQEPVVVKKFCQLEALGRFVLKKNREICAAGIIP